MAKKYNGGIPTPTSIKVEKSEPSDDRDVVEVLNDLKTLEYVYPGIIVKVESDNYIQFQWNGLDQTNLDNWKKVSSEPNIKNWFQGEIIQDLGVNIYRFYNGNIYEFIGVFPFTTNSIENELNDWKSKISTFPAPQDVIITPPNIPPNTTRFVQVNGLNLTKLITKMNFGNDIDVLAYIYNSTTEILVELQSNANYVTVFPTITNGTETTLTSSFSVSGGVSYVPNTFTENWQQTNADIIYSIGGFEQQLTGAKDAGYFKGIPINTDFDLIFKTEALTTNGGCWFSFKPEGGQNSSGTTNMILPLRIAYFGDRGTPSWSTIQLGYDDGTTSNWVQNAIIKVKRVMQSTTVCNVYYYVNDVLMDQVNNVDVTANWYPFWATIGVTKHSNIQLTIF